MLDHDLVYQYYANQYDRLVSCEDYQGNLLSALQRITALEGKDVIELGAGTGRLTCLLAPRVKSIRAFDTSQQMLDVARTKLQRRRFSNCRLGVADHRALPVADRIADISLSGWSVCYLVDSSRAVWHAEVEKALAEMQRMLRPGGALIILETLGTGYETPHSPENLMDYYRLLDSSGFSSTWIRTDYQFASLSEAVALTRFFFGEELAVKVDVQQQVLLPECTGIWWRKA